MKKPAAVVAAAALLPLGLTMFAAQTAPAQKANPTAPPKGTSDFFKAHCLDCHNADTKQGNLDLTALPLEPQNAKSFAQWVKIHDRVRAGEMPPPAVETLKATDKAAFLQAVANPLQAADDVRAKQNGRATWRRMNRYEYENTLRDLLDAPYLQIKEMLPEDGQAYHFNKVGDALDVSHVQMSRYLAAADYALRDAMAQTVDAPQTTTTRYYARDQQSFTGPAKFTFFNGSPERATFPIIGNQA